MLEMERVLPSSTVLEMTRKGSTNAEQDMKELVGLEDVKEKMSEMASRMEFDKENGTAQANSCMHMCFFGPPGTGKTTCARIMTGFLYKYDYIKNNRLIEVDGNFLADDYASLKTEMLVQKAFGGVLFIDEAYSLLNNLSGQEAIATLIKQMEDNKDKFILILAGYEDEMKALIEANPGFSSRIKEYFYFKGYNEKELNHIFGEMAKEVGLVVSAAAQNTFKDYMTEAMKDYHFGNARTVRNVLDSSINKHSLNLKKGIVREAFRIEKEDISYESIELAGFPWNRNRR